MGQISIQSYLEGVGGDRVWDVMRQEVLLQNSVRKTFIVTWQNNVNSIIDFQHFMNYFPSLLQAETLENPIFAREVKREMI
jgi:hypothetical protein